MDKQPIKVHHHLARAVSLKGLGAEVKAVEGINAKIAVMLTRGVGTMACAYLFCVLALLSLPDILIQAGVLTKGDVPHFLAIPGLILIVAWIAQTFIQLVLLSVIMVGQSVQSAASDARAVKTFEDTERILDALDISTEGGIKDVLDAIKSVDARLADSQLTKQI